MAELISLEGDGLKSGFTGVANSFRVNMSGMNVAKLVVSFQGPQKPQVALTNQKDGNVSGSYTTSAPGEYTMSVTFDDDHVEGSPFKIQVAQK